MSETSSRALRARMAAHASWANTADPAERTANARAASPSSLDWFERRIDPDGLLEPQERRRRAEHARKAYFLQLAMKSAEARRKPGAA